MKRPLLIALLSSAMALPAAAALKSGDEAPDFSAKASLAGHEFEFSLAAALRKGPVVVYFYPRDDTPGCTKEACGFNDALASFAKLGTEVIGISKDSEKSHGRFREKYGLKFHLGSDVDTKVLQAYGAWTEKSLYGRKYMGIERSTFLVDKAGVIRAVWRGVKVPGHVDEVLAAVKAL